MTTRVILGYLGSVIFFAAFTFLAASAWNLRILGCESGGYSLGAYMASCSSAHYGDYEHGAIAFQFERDAISALKASDAVYFGFSYGMVALSSAATDRYFKSKSARFYNLGFSGEYSPFYDDILPTLDLHPRVVIIDVEPFFVSSVSAPNRFIRDHPYRAWIDYAIKHEWQRAQKAICERGLVPGRTVCGPSFSMFRVVESGRLLIDYGAIYGRPLPRIPIKRDSPVSADVKDLVTRNAAAFLSRHHIDPACVIMFAAPNSFGNQTLAAAVASGVGAQFVDVAMPGLATVDTGHLAQDDAEIWSEQFWKAADPVIAGCLSRPAPLETTERKNARGVGSAR